MTPERLVKMQALPVGLLLFSVTWAAPVSHRNRDKCGDKGSIHGASVYPEPMEGKGTEEGDTLLNLPAQERYSAALKASITQAVKRPDTGTKLRRDRNEEKKPKSVLNVIPADAINDAKNGLKGAENQRKYLPSSNSSAKSEGTHRTRRSAHYPKHLLQTRESPSNFEGSGSPDSQARGDNDIPPFSGDGQHAIRIPSKGGAIGPGPESSASRHVGLSGSGKAEIVNPHSNTLGSNEIPGREGHGGNAAAPRDKTAQAAGAAGVSLVEGSNEITGSTNFRELPGKEGNRIDAGSQNAHQGKVEFHYPRVPSKEKVKGGGSHNDIPKSGRGSSRKDGEEPKRNQVENQRFPVPSQGLGKEVKSEGDPSKVSHSERILTAHSRENRYVLHGPNNSTRNKGMSQWRGSRPSRRPHFHRRFSTRQGDSSESSSDSSSESEGD
ncbi:matrix extracellular phosphoglycoprotein [Acomys russatus]|uniref:matrix extracellular phosphoglycoprotein n=1 Tax=Acomys russatus TaxID=60746 RepID=UPI0021E1EA09|nr:matrix extracellular phosphoglycoprotein [Acomys russatus]